MRTLSLTRLTPFLVAFVWTVACENADGGTPAPLPKNDTDKPTSTWWTTCGGPVCQGWNPNESIPLCAGQNPGDSCGKPGDKCDPKGPCGEYLLCVDSDPKSKGCPISRRSRKEAISYLDDAQRQQLTQTLLQTRLATYRYTAQGPQGERHLGFILDDQPGSPAVDEKRDMVDLYGYLSMSVAALQQQQKRIDALDRELQAMRTHCK